MFFCATTYREWFEVSEIRGHIDGGTVAHFRVGLKVGFHLDDAD